MLLDVDQFFRPPIHHPVEFNLCRLRQVAMDLHQITHALVKALADIDFAEPITHVYNPLVYAARPHANYLQRFGKPPKEVLLVGMNPGPWGMAQTGVPFGEVEAVTDWMGISGRVDQPHKVHSKRPVAGFDCLRREVSGKRLWGWVRKTFGSPRHFFNRFYVGNYCPLMFFDAAGRNRTPNLLKAAEKKRLFKACDKALERTVDYLKPEFVVGVGKFAAERAFAATAGMGVKTGGITHPSPANPKANRGWEPLIEKELKDLGIQF